MGNSFEQEADTVKYPLSLAACGPLFKYLPLSDHLLPKATTFGALSYPHGLEA